MARKEQQRNGVFGAACADGYARNKGTATEERYFL
jgi:hypothetical protein